LVYPTAETARKTKRVESDLVGGSMENDAKAFGGSEKKRGG